MTDVDALPAFRLNGRAIPLAGSDPTESLLRWLRRNALPGTKEGCADGDCGACTVALLVPADGTGPGGAGDGGWRYQAVNSCLLPLGSLVGRELLTVEALDAAGGLHPVQQAMVECAGSQCGYCTPGFVMSLFVAAHSDGAQVLAGDEAIEGNLCRCTGYRPIRAAAASIDMDAVRAHPLHRLPQAPRPAPSPASLGTFHSPTSIDEAVLLKARHPQAAWIAGATDLGVALSHERIPAPAFIALDRIDALRELAVGEDEVVIGAGVPLSRLEHALRGALPMLDAMLPWFAARQVRNRATLGGNLGSASPIGDLLPILLALDARIVLRGPAGERSLPADGFFLDYRRTQRADDELVLRVHIPRPAADASQGFYKVAKRQTDDISIVAAAFLLQRRPDGRITQACLAFGGVAAVPTRALAVERWLVDRCLDHDTVAAACAQLQEAFSPISDHRAGAGYRRQLCGNLFARFVTEQCR